MNSCTLKMKSLFHVLIFVGIFLHVDSVRYDRYSGKLVKEAVEKELMLENANVKCSIDIKPCTPHEGSRIDGTCNKFKYPSKGSAKGPYLRLLAPDYGNITQGRNRSSLPSARLVRTTLQSTGRVDDKQTFTIAAYHYLDFIRRDVSALSESRDLWKQGKCCEADGRSQPIKVPDDDPYLKVTNIRYLNFTRAETFQDAGCTPEIIPLEQINFQTPLLDLSTIYGVDKKGLESIRFYKLGLLQLDTRKGRLLPLNMSSPININISSTNTTGSENKINMTKIVNEKSKQYETLESMLTMKTDNMTSSDICMQNKHNEKICYLFGFPEVGNFDLRTTALGTFFMREHNRTAKELHLINPCWKDDRLFKVARQINIATAANIFMYELMPLLLGYDNMVAYNLISNHVEQLTAYYESEVPLVYAEWEIATRYFRTLLDGRIKKYDEDYQLIGELSLSDTLYRQGLLEEDLNLEEISRGTFYQHAGKADDIQDPEVSEKFYGDLQTAYDLPAADIQRGRDLGVRSYNDYREFCGMKPATRFEDFLDVMEKEKVLALRKLYNNTEDVDLLAGIMSESHWKGTIVGPTLFCIMTKQLQLWRFADRFWFERGDQLRSFNLAQLHEMRRTNMARLACDNADIKHVQPRAFLNVGHGNQIVPCNQIGGPDLHKWADYTCRKNNGQVPYSKIHNNGINFELNHEWNKKPYEKRTQGKQDPNNMIINYSNFFDQMLSLRQN